MHIVLLSGGSGKRLWPLSNDVRSKQFLKLFKAPDGAEESMVQRVYRQIKTIFPEAIITIATSKSQVSSLKSQLGDLVYLSVEPGRRDTFPAISLASLYLKDILGVDEQEAIIVCPVDPFVEECFFYKFKELLDLTVSGKSNVNLMGIQPTYPSEKYGYILPEKKGEVSSVIAFKEKPSKNIAEDLIKEGALWNSGVFSFKLGYLLNIIKERLGIVNYIDLINKYNDIDKNSFDYEVLENESEIKVLRFHGTWKDLGTWNTLTEAIGQINIGNSKIDDDCKNVHVINDTDMNVLAMGLENVIIAVGDQGILVSDREHSSYIKPFVEKMNQQIMYAEKSWGSYRVINVGEKSLTLRVFLRAGHSMNYHSHQYRDETWVVTEGVGVSTVDGMEDEICPGDVVSMAAGCKHKIFAKTDLYLIEVQIGQEISVDDKEKF